MHRLLPLILCLLPSFLLAQTPNRYFPLPGLPEYHFWGYCAPVIPTPDGGYLLNYGYGAPNIHAGSYGGDLIKTDSAFLPQWRIGLNGESGRNAIGYADGSTVVLSSAGEIGMRKVDGQGNRIWDRRIYRGPSYTQVINDLLSRHLHVELVGYLASVDPFGLYTSSSPMVLELDSAGNFVRMDSFDLPGMTFPNVEAAAHDAAGNLYLSGTAHNGASITYLAKLDTNHAVVWGYTMSCSSGQPIFGEIVELANGDLLLGGKLNNSATGYWSMVLVRMSATGSVVWAVTTNEIGEVSEVMEKPNGHLIVTGNHRAFFPDTVKLMVMETNANGSPLWAKTYTPGIGMGEPLLHGPDEWVFPAMGEYDPMLLAMDTLGNSTCFMTQVNPVSYSTSLSMNPQAFNAHPVTMGFSPLVADSVLGQPYIDSCYHVVPTGLTEAPNVGLQAFPNPGTGLLTLQAPAAMQTVHVTNALGQIVLQLRPETNVLQIHLLESGVYWIAAQTAEGTLTRRVTVVR